MNRNNATEQQPESVSMTSKPGQLIVDLPSDSDDELMLADPGPIERDDTALLGYSFLIL